MIGEVPLGETLVDHGARIIVADSNLNALAGVPSNVAVISTADALTGKPALLGYVPTGPVPRQFAVVPGGATLLLAVQSGHEFQAIKEETCRDQIRPKATSGRAYDQMP